MTTNERTQLRRQVLKTSVETLLTDQEKACASDKLDEEDLQIIIKLINQKMVKIEEFDNSIADSTDMDELNDELATTEKWTTEIKRRIGKLSKFTKSDQKQGQVPARRMAKKKTLEIPKFNGAILEFLSFKDIFQSLIISDNQLDPIEKFGYLLECLSGEARAMLDGLGLTADNFSHAWALLNDRYGKTEKLTAAYMKALWTITPPGPSVGELTRFYDKLQSCTRALQSLGEDEKSYGTLLIPMLIEKLPSALVVQITRDRKVGHWTIKSLNEAIYREINALSTTTDLPSPFGYYDHNFNDTRTRTGEFTPPPTGAFLSGASNYGYGKKKLCPFCGQTDQHSATQCRVVTDIDKRRRIAERDRLCFNCLNPNHRSDMCRSANRCQQCGGKHHTALHNTSQWGPPRNRNSQSARISMGVDASTTPVPAGTQSSLASINGSRTDRASTEASREIFREDSRQSDSVGNATESRAPRTTVMNVNSAEKQDQVDITMAAAASNPNQ